MKLIYILILIICPLVLLGQKDCKKQLKSAIEERNNTQAKLTMAETNNRQLNDEVEHLKRKISKYEEELKIHRGEVINSVETPDSQQLEAYRELEREYDKRLQDLDKLVRSEDRLKEQNEILQGEKKEWKNKFDSLFIQQKQILERFQQIQKEAQNNFGDTIIIDWQKNFDSLLITLSDLSNKYTEKPPTKTKKDTVVLVQPVAISPKVLKLQEEIGSLEKQLASNETIYNEANLLVENYFRAEAKFYALGDNRYTVSTSRTGFDKRGLKYQVSSLDNCSNSDIIEIAKYFVGGLERHSGVTKTSLDKLNPQTLIILKCNRQTANQVKLELIDLPFAPEIQYTPSKDASIFIELKSDNFFEQDLKSYNDKKSRIERNIRVKEQRIKKLEDE